MKYYPFGIEDLYGEEWRDIEGYEGHYQISNYGRIKSFDKGQVFIVKPKLIYTAILKRGCQHILSRKNLKFIDSLPKLLFLILKIKTLSIIKKRLS